MISIFVDINVVVDIFLERQPFYTSSAKVFGLVETKKLRGYFGALSYPILYYVLRKEVGGNKAREILNKVRQVLHTAPVLENIIDFSLKSNLRDFEDAIQYYSAMDIKCEYFVTRNKKDFPPNSMQIVTPKEFLEIFQSQQSNDN